MPSQRNIEHLEALTATLKGAEGSFFVVDYQGLEAGPTGKLLGRCGKGWRANRRQKHPDP